MKPVPKGPAPLLLYRGSQLSLSVASGEKIGVHYAVDQKMVGKEPVTTVRTAVINIDQDDPPANITRIHYCHNDQHELHDPAFQESSLVTFSVLTDPKGGLIGADFALEVMSNYPGIPMSVGRTRIDQPGLKVLAKQKLPVAYLANLELRFWTNGKGPLELDGWLSVQAAYELEQDGGKMSPSIPIGKVVVYPALSYSVTT